MSDIVSLLKESSSTNMETRNQVDLQGEPFKTFKFKTESITPKVQATTIKVRNLSGNQYLIWDNPTYGIWDSFLWGGDITSELVLNRVVPNNDSFEENFLSDYFISTSETTATRTLGNMNFNVTSELLVSEIIYKNSTAVTKATMSIVSTSDVSNFGLYLSNDSGSSWENVTNGTLHYFDDNTGEVVKYKVTPITPDKNITKIIVDINK